jgi:hypothetical protein
MKRVLAIVLGLCLLSGLSVNADIDTIEGTATDSLSDIEGTATDSLSDIEGSTVSVADVTAPEVSGNPVIDTDGDTVTITFTESVVTTGYDTGDFDIDCDGASGANNNLSYTSGSGSSSVVFATTSTVQSGETCNLDYTGGADEIEDGSGNDLETFSDDAMTNNSTQGAGGPDIWYYSGGQTEDDFETNIIDSGYQISSYSYGADITVAQNGTATALRIKTDSSGSGGVGFRLCLYDSSDNPVASCTGTTTSTGGYGWDQCSISESITAGTYYLFASPTTDTDNLRLAYDAGSDYYLTAEYDAMCLSSSSAKDTEAELFGLAIYVD